MTKAEGGGESGEGEEGEHPKHFIHKHIVEKC